MEKEFIGHMIVERAGVYEIVELHSVGKYRDIDKAKSEYKKLLEKKGK